MKKLSTPVSFPSPWRLENVSLIDSVDDNPLVDSVGACETGCLPKGEIKIE